MKRNNIVSLAAGLLCSLWILAAVFASDRSVLQFSITQSVFYLFVTIQALQSSIPPITIMLPVIAKLIIAAFGIILVKTRGDAFFQFGKWTATNILIIADYILTACLIVALIVIVIYISPKPLIPFDFDAEFRPFTAEVGDGDTQEVCSICLDPFNQNTVKSVTCSHVFHRKCIKSWIDAGHCNCPNCHVEFSTVKVLEAGHEHIP